MNLFKRLGRVSNVRSSEMKKTGIKIIVNGETVILYFDQNLNLSEQKLKISSRVKDLDNKILVVNNKLKNKKLPKLFF